MLTVSTRIHRIAIGTIDACTILWATPSAVSNSIARLDSTLIKSIPSAIVPSRLLILARVKAVHFRPGSPSRAMLPVSFDIRQIVTSFTLARTTDKAAFWFIISVAVRGWSTMNRFKAVIGQHKLRPLVIKAVLPPVAVRLLPVLARRHAKDEIQVRRHAFAKPEELAS